MSEIQQFKKVVDEIVANVETVIRGKTFVIRQALACWMAGGHILFEDVPGTGKTILARALARSVKSRTKRVQFTPDLMPSDIIGNVVFSKEQNQFAFVPGPVFTGVLLADEINRATPRTQSALLQAMAERQVTAENKTYALPESFFVIATQNPVDQHGVFPLPEAQLDRFMMRASMGYPDAKSEKEVIMSQLQGHPIETLEPVTTESDWLKVCEAARRIQITEPVIQYALALVNATRTHIHLQLGGSPRSSIALIRSAQAFALMEGLDFVKPDLVKKLAPSILEHRLVLTTKAKLERVDTHSVVQTIVNSVSVPT